MTSINALVHHIDQLLTEHRALQLDQTQLQSRVKELENQLLEQQQTAATLAQEKVVVVDDSQNVALEVELKQLIGLFDQATEATHD